MKTKEEMEWVLSELEFLAEQISQHIQADEAAQYLALMKSCIDILSFVLDKPNSIDGILPMINKLKKVH